MVAPLVDIKDGKVTKFYGCLAMDEFMTSGTRDFINKFYGSNLDGQLVDYLIFKDEDEYLKGDFDNSKMAKTLS